MNTKILTKLKIAAVTFSALAATAVQAGDVFFDFETDPTLPGSGFLMEGNHKPNAWCSALGTATNGNPATGGYLSIADGNLGGSQLVAVFPDIDGGLPIKAFHLTADVRAGNSGNGDGRPADGFSISYAREGDAVLKNATNGVAGGAAGGDDDATTTSPLGSGDLENGTKSGVAIIFDAWQGNRLPDTGAGGVPGPDVEGIAIRVDDKTLRQVDMQADRNGSCYSPTNADCGAAVCADSNTEQTGPWANDGGAPDSDGTLLGLCWARLDVELTVDKKVTVIWKGRTLVDHVQIANYPNHRGRLVLMGRTGGNSQNAHFDNIHLTTTPALEATFDRLAFGPNLNQFQAFLSDNGASTITSISSVILDGVNVTPSTTWSHVGTASTITYTQVPFFVSGSTHTVTINWQTSLGQSLSASNQTFTVTPYLVLPASLSVPPASIDLAKPGFDMQPYQIWDGTPNRIYYADEVLFGLHGTNAIDFTSVPNYDGNGVVTIDGPIDYSNGGTGQFPVDQGWETLGVPGPGVPNDNNTMLASSSYLYFPTAGLYTFGGNSDDGFRVSFGRNSKDVLGAELGALSFDGGRGIGNNQNLGSVYVGTAGYYGCRFIFFNGGGGCNVEFYTVSTPAGVTNVLVNDTNAVGQAVLCYRASSAAPAYPSLASPPLDDNQVFANRDLDYKITDASTTVLPVNVSLTVNGVLRAPVVTKAGGVTDVALTHPAALWPQGTNTVSLVYTDSAGSNYNHTYSFIVQPYASLPTNLVTALGSGFNPGMRMKSYQTSNNAHFVNGFRNVPQYAIEGAEGFFPDNQADQTLFTHNGQFWNSGVINFSQNGSGAVTDNGDFRSTDTPTAHPDSAAPGLPGGPSMDNDSWVARTFLEFPAAGFYLMGVNSDDGFRVIHGDRMGPGQSLLSILAPQSIAGDVQAMNQTELFGGALPVPPIIAQAVLCNPPWPTAMPVNAAALAGKIAILHRDPSGGVAAHSYWAQQAGAIAVVFVDQDDLGPTRYASTFGTGSPTPTIPVVMIGYTAGTNMIAKATATSSSPVVLTLGDGSNVKIGEFVGGRGASDTLFALNVPSAGVYPMTLWWENGGGDANCEWFMQDQITGAKTLVNDTGSAVKAWIQRTVPAAAHLNQPVVSGSNMTMSWTGKGELEFSYYVTGPWFQAVSQANPQTVPLNNGLPVGQTFYRVRTY